MIEKATIADAAELAALQVASWRSAYAPLHPGLPLGDSFEAEMAANWASLPGEVWVARGPDGAAEGFVTLKTRHGWPYIHNLHVRPGLRGRGTGAALIAEAACALRDKGEGRMWLTVLARNIGARRFYARQGGFETAPFTEELLGEPVTAYPVLWLSLDPLADKAKFLRKTSRKPA